LCGIAVQYDLPPIESLECFAAAAATGNFRKAAQRVHLSASAFGQRIRQLEDYLQVRLFERTTRQVHLSEAGQRLLPTITEMLARMTELPEMARDTSGIVPRSLTVGTRHELGISWLTPAIRDLEDLIPGLTLHLYFGSGTEFWELLEARQIDAVVTSARLPSRRFAFERLHEERYVMVASSRLARRDKLRTVEDLRSQVLVDSNPSLPLARYWLDAEPDRAHLQFGDFRYLGTIAAIRDFVLRGSGVAVLPEYFVNRDIRAGRLKRLFSRKKVLSDHFRLVYLPGCREAALVQSLAAELRKMPLR
jgi:DNA-binding transcriptional LysR family regulator